jgi:hypothetical protein
MSDMSEGSGTIEPVEEIKLSEAMLDLVSGGAYPGFDPDG